MEVCCDFYQEYPTFNSRLMVLKSSNLTVLIVTKLNNGY